MQLILQVKAQNVVVGTKKMTESVMEEANGGLSAGDSTSIFAPEDDLQAETLEMSPDCLVKVPGSFELEEPSLSTIEPTKNNEQFAYIYNNHNESIFDDEQFSLHFWHSILPKWPSSMKIIHKYLIMLR